MAAWRNISSVKKQSVSWRKNQRSGMATQTSISGIGGVTNVTRNIRITYQHSVFLVAPRQHRQQNVSRQQRHAAINAACVSMRGSVNVAQLA